MAKFQLALVFATLAVVFITAQEGPQPRIVLDSITMEAKKENEYFGDWIGTVHPGGQKVTVQCPVHKDLPEDMKVNVTIKFNEQVIIDFITNMCDGLDDETVGKGIIKYAEPKGEFPEQCPFTAIKSCKIHEYIMPDDKLPPDTKPGPIEALIIFFLDPKYPIMIIKALGEIIVG